MSNSQKSLSMRNNVLWNSIGNLIYWGSSWLTTILVVRLGSYELAGILSLAMSVSSTIYCISAYGVYNYQVSDLKNQYTPDDYMSMRIISAILGYLICIILCITQNYSLYQVGCILLYMVYKTIECFVNVIQAEEQKAGRMDYIGKAYIIRGIGTLGVFIISMYVTEDLLITIGVMCVYSLVVYGIYDLPKVHLILGKKYTITSVHATSLLLSCLPMALYWLFNTLIPTIPKLAIEQILGTELLGVYASISSPLLIISMAANFILTPLISPLSNYYFLNKFKEFKSASCKIFLGMIVCGGICYVGGRIFIAPVLNILYGNYILDYLNIAYYIVIVVVLSAIISYLNIIFTIFRKLWLLVVLNGGASIVAWVACNLFINNFGMQGANYALMIVYLLQIFIMIIVSLCIYTKWKSCSEEKHNED